MPNRMMAKVLWAGVIGAAAMAAAPGVPAVYGTTGTLANNNNIYPFVPGFSLAGNINLDGTSPTVWAGGIIPNGNGDIANIGYNTTAYLNNSATPTINSQPTISLPANMRLGILNFQLDSGYYSDSTGTPDHATNFGRTTDNLIFNNTGGATPDAQIKVAATSHIGPAIGAVITLENNVVVTMNGGTALTVQGGGIAASSTGNFIIEGGGTVSLNVGSNFGNTKILVNHGTFTTTSSAVNILGVGNNAGIYVAQGGQFVSGAGTVAYTAPIHLAGTGNRLSGALNTAGTIGIGNGIFLDADTWISSGTINDVIYDSNTTAGGKKLTVAYRSGEGAGSRVVTFGANMKYTGGTEIMGFGLPLNFSSNNASVLGNITVQGGAMVGLTGLANLYDRAGGPGTGSGVVVLQAPVYNNMLENFSNFSTNKVINTDGQFHSAGGILRLDGDFDPTTIISGNSTGGGVLESINNATTSMNVYRWGDGTVRFGAYTTSTSSSAFTVINYNGTLSATNGGGSPQILNLGYGSANKGEVGIGAIDLTGIQINAPIGTVSGVDIRAGQIVYAANMTYSGDTNVGYLGTLYVTNYSNGQLGSVGGAINVNAGGTLALLSGNAARGTVNINGGGVATLSNSAVAQGNVTVQGTDPGNGSASVYRGLINYNANNAVTPIAGSPTTGGVTANKYGQITLAAGIILNGTNSNLFTLNDLGVLRGTSTQLNNLNTNTTLGNFKPNGGVIQNINSADGVASISTLVARLGSTPKSLYGFVVTPATVTNNDNWSIGDSASSPWLGLAGGSDESPSMLAANANVVMTVTLNGNATLAGLPSGQNSSTQQYRGAFNATNTRTFTVNANVTGTANNLYIRGGGIVALAPQIGILDANGVSIGGLSNFSAPITVSENTTLSVSNMAFLGAANNVLTLVSGGRLQIQGANNTTRVVNIGAGGGGLRTTSTATFGAADELVSVGGSTTNPLAIFGTGVIDLQANNSLFTGPVRVLGSTLKLSHAAALQSANGISVGLAPDALVAPVMSLGTTSFPPIFNTLGGSYGSLLLDPALAYTGGGTLGSITMNGGALGFTTSATLDPSALTLGAQMVLSSLNVKPIAADPTVAGSIPASYTLQVLQGTPQNVKVLQLGGASSSNSALVASGTTLTLNGNLADSGGTPVLLLINDHNQTVDARGTAPTYSGGTYIYDGILAISNANNIGPGAIEISSAYSTTATTNSGRLHIVDNGTDHQVTFSANQFFRFAGASSTVGTTGAVINRNAAYIDVDNGVTATINAIDNSLAAIVDDTTGMIAKTGLGTLKLNIAQNAVARNALVYSAYLGGGTLEVDSMPAGGLATHARHVVVFDGNSNNAAVGGTLVVHAPPAGSNFGDVQTIFTNSDGGGYGFKQYQVRDFSTDTIKIDSGALFYVNNGGFDVQFNGTLIIDGADLSATALFANATSSNATTNGNGVLDIRGGRVTVVNDLNFGGGGKIIPVDNAAFTLKVQGGEYDGNDYASNTSKTSPGAVPINANLVISNQNSSTGGLPAFGGALPVTIQGNSNTTWTGMLVKKDSGWLIFNRNGGTFTSDATTALTIEGGQFVVNGNDIFANGGFVAHKVTVNNNSATDSGSGAGLYIASNDALTGNRVLAAITGTGGTQVAGGATLLVGSSPGNISQGTLRLTGSGNIRNDGQALAASFNSALAGTVNLSANVSNALFIDVGSTAKVGEVTLANTSTGGILNGTLIAHGLTISGASGSFTMNAGSNLTLDPTVTNNGTFTYNGGTTNATGINSANAALGSLVVNANLALNEVRQGVKVQVAASTVLTLNTSGTPTTGGTDANYSRMGSLVLAGANNAWTSKLDVNDNKVIIDNANTAQTNQTYANTVNQLKQGYGNGTWNGTGGIISSKANTELNVNGNPVTLGVMNNNDGSGNPFAYGDGTDLPQFAGQSVTANDVLLKYTYFGDADLSGSVDSVDYGYFVAGVAGVGTGWQWGDFDYSGGIPDSVDYGWFVVGNSAQGAPLAASGSGSNSVPEPASLALLGLGAIVLLRRGKR